MQDIKIYQKIDVKNPTMFAAWPGMGNVALGGINYLRRKTNAVLFAEIDVSQFVMPESIVIEKGVAKLPTLPKNLFYYTHKPESIIFEGESQLVGEPGIKLVNLVLDLAEEYKVQTIYTGAAFPSPISHNEASTVYATANLPSLSDFLKKCEINIMEEGQISGLNGLLIGFAISRKIEAACLLATMPLYAINFPNPKASKALVEAFQKILNIQYIDMKEIDINIQDMGTKMEMVEEKIKEVFPLEKEDKKQDQEEKTPHYVLEKIERLFREAKIDRRKAHLLKEELDRWNLYKLYEDKFLDLFKEHQ